VHAALDRAGYEVLGAATARSAEPDRHREADLLLFDLGLPDRNGLDHLPLILARIETKVLVASAREATEEKVAALDPGADDFVTKPFDTDELLARVRVALRHRAMSAGRSELRELGQVIVDFSDSIVRRSGREVHLTPEKWSPLAELTRPPGRVMTHTQLLRAVWGPAHELDVE
jgi:two-component system KDP operon response regulator KdpE